MKTGLKETPNDEPRTQTNGSHTNSIKSRPHVRIFFLLISVGTISLLNIASLGKHFDLRRYSNILNYQEGWDLPWGSSSSNEYEEEYISWLQEQRNETKYPTGGHNQPPLIMYRAVDGLGHQLLRMSSLYHLAMMYQIPKIFPTVNPYCGGLIFDIYGHLIGEGQLLVNIPFFGNNNLFRNRTLFKLPPSWPRLEIVNETELSNETRKSLKRQLNIINEIPGYGHSNTWGIHKEFNANNFHNNFWGKDISDYQFYSQLMLLFQQRHNKRILDIVQRTRFEEHTVFALHVRAGNGEKGDFAVKKRGFANLDEWITSAIRLLCDYKGNHTDYFTAKPLMIYVGTDTGSVVPKLQNASQHTCNIPIVSADQAYPDEGNSVSYKQQYEDANATHSSNKCLKGWEDMMLDMYFFTKCNTVVTGSYSSFTQSAPMSFILHRAKSNSKNSNQHPSYFCDMSADGTRMDCYDTLRRWLEQNSTFIWGDENGSRAVFREEVAFPNMWRSVGEIRNLFKNTVLVERGEMLRKEKEYEQQDLAGGRTKIPK